MKNVNTDSYMVVEVIGGLDAYCEDVLVCCLTGKTLEDFTYDEKVDTDKLETAIDNEIELLDLMAKITEDL
jgi:hypothetical protein